MTFNLTLLQQSNTLSGLMQYANNEATGTLFMTLLMLAVFFIMLMTLLRFGPTRAVMTSGLLCFIISGLLWNAKLIQLYMVLSFLAITALAIFYSIASPDSLKS